MPESCSRRVCNNEKYHDSDKCILHCDKSNFDRTDLNQFWLELYTTYFQDAKINADNPAIIKDVVFPSTEYNNNRLDHYLTHFPIEFVKCVFKKDFSFHHINIRNKITFDNCIFYENICFASVNEIEILNESEFKSEILLGNRNWNKIELQSTKFIKDVSLNVKGNLNIDNCVFRKDLNIDGFSSLELNIQNSECDKQLIIQRTAKSNIDDVQLKSNVYFNGNNTEMALQNINFKKDVSFKDFSTLSIFNSQFDKKINFTGTHHKEVTINNTKINDIEISSCDTLNITNNSELNGNLKLSGECQNLSIENSKISKKLNVDNAMNVLLKDCHVWDTVKFSGNYNDFSITESSFVDLSINTTHTIKIDKTKIVGNFDLSGEEYESILIENSKISNRLQISKVTKLELNKVTNHPYVKLIYDEYEDVSISNSRLFDLGINSVKNLSICKSTIKGAFNLLGEKNDNITFDTVVFKNRCDFPNISALVLNKSTFSKEINFNTIGSLVATDTAFNDEVIFLTKYTTIQLIGCTFYQKIKLSEIDNILDIKSSSFKNEVDLSEGNFNNINILSSHFEGNLLFSSSTIQKINLASTEEIPTVHSSFSLLVDFAKSLIHEIKISNCDFNNKLNFIDISNKINLSNISNTTIEDLVLCNSLVFDLFQNSKMLTINNFTLENTKLDTTNASNEIDINNIIINDFKCNKLVLLKDMNFIEMTINKLRIGNSNIEDRFRIKESDIGIFNLISSTFEDLQIIDNKSDVDDRQKELRLKNTTIKNAVFDKLKYNDFIMNDAHVSEAKIGNVQFKNGSRETNRFFKNYYDSISDYIKANEYYQREMEEHYKTTRDRWEWLVLDFGKGVSNFGQSWIRPLVWAFLFTLLFYRIANFDLLSMDGFREHHISWMINDILKFVNPFTKSITHNYGNLYWAWILHKVLMTIFTYHFIVAVKRKTKR